MKTLPKGFSLCKKLSSEFGLIFRQNGDTGEERRMTTPSVEDVECNLEMFLQKWEKQLSEVTMDAIKKLRNHIRKGCCSGIPPKAGTQKNERLHKLLKKSLLGGASVISPELAIVVLSYVLYIWSCKRDPTARKHSSNARITPVVPVELKNQHLLSNFASDVTVTRKFKSSIIPTEIPVAMKSDSSAKCDTSMKSTNLDEMVSDAITHDVKELCNESVLNYIILRTLHLNEVCSSIGNKCRNRDFDMINFPIADIERFIKVLHSDPNRSDVVLNNDMNQECLEKNLLSFGLEIDAVPGDGNCCFRSIEAEMNKLISFKGNEYVHLVEYLKSIGLCNGIETDTSRLRKLFCDEIIAKQQNYQTWVDFDITKEIEKFSQSGWFNSSLGDLCVVACSNILKTTIVVITSIPGVPFIPFVPSDMLTDNTLHLIIVHCI